jgi:hypothetical protein
VSAIDGVLERLERVTRSGDGWSARCPAHDDRHASLSVGVGADGRVLLHCHAGCSIEAIAHAAGVPLRDLFEQDEPPVSVRATFELGEDTVDSYRASLDGRLLGRLEELRGWTPDVLARCGVGFDGELVTFPYRDASGRLVGLARYQPNEERRNGSKLKADAGSRRDLFPPPETLSTEAGFVYLVEGEPDALRLLSVGIAACGYPGVNGWRRQYAERFRGQVVILAPDCDEPGGAAAERIARDLVAIAADVRLLDLDPQADDGFDVSDFLREARTENHRDEARRILTRCAGMAPSVAEQSASAPIALGVVPAEEFSSVDEAGGNPVVGEPGEAVIPEDGDVMVYGDGGAGKTTLSNDLGCHLAAGDDWLGFPIAKAVRVLVVENEGPRPLFRLKLRRKLAGWTGSPLKHHLFVLEKPWAELSFADPGCRASLAAIVRQLEIDVVIVGPVTRSGMDEAGTLQEVRDFMRLVADVRAQAARRVAFVLVHHENKGGRVSGAWEASGDTLLHVQAQGHGRTRLYVQKARWSSSHHATALQLIWTDGEGFEVENKPEFDDDAIADKILDALAEAPGTAWTKVEKKIQGVGNDRLRAIRDGLLAGGRIVNRVKREGLEVLSAECEPRRTASLYVAEDPTIAHLRQDSGAAPAQTAPARGEGGPLQLRRAPRPIRGAGVGAADSHPSETVIEAQP